MATADNSENEEYPSTREIDPSEIKTIKVGFFCILCRILEISLSLNGHGRFSFKYIPIILKP